MDNKISLSTILYRLAQAIGPIQCVCVSVIQVLNDRDMQEGKIN